MRLQTSCSALSVIAVTCTLVTAAPADAQRRDGRLLPPDKSGQVTVTGCLARGETIRGGQKGKYVLARLIPGAVDSVPEASCTADPGADALALDHAIQSGLKEEMLGRWVQLSGRLEKEESLNPDNLRELDVESFRLVPVVTPTVAAPPPRRPAARPAAPVVQPPPPPAPAPVAITPEPPQTLPKTASPIPAIGLLGLFSLAGGFILRSVRPRE